jgi:hypothetical protein
VPSGDIGSVRLQLSDARPSGTAQFELLDSKHRPLEGIDVKLELNCGSALGPWEFSMDEQPELTQVTTDASGQALAEQLCPGIYGVGSPVGERYQPQFVIVPPGATVAVQLHEW